MSATAERPTAAGPSKVRRLRLIAFWVLLVLLLFLHFGERPQMLVFPITAFGDVGELATHEVHMFGQGLFAWTVLAAVAVQLRRPSRQVGAAWSYALATVIAFTMIAALADLPGNVVPILIAAIGLAVLAFFAHPASLRAKVTSTERPSVLLLALTVIGAIPLVTYAAGQIAIHLGSGAHDEHWLFGHWIIMAAVAFVAVGLAGVAAAKVSGWRFPLWAAGLIVAALGAGSLGINAVSQLSTGWALAALLWGAAFITAGELQDRRAHTHAPAAVKPAT